jgi:hypothetical protein
MTVLGLTLQRSALARPVPGTLLIDHCDACHQHALLAYVGDRWRCDDCREVVGQPRDAA